MPLDPIDPRLESVRAVLWAIARVLDSDAPPSRAAVFELRALSKAGLQLADDYLESLALA